MDGCMNGWVGWFGGQVDGWVNGGGRRKVWVKGRVVAWVGVWVDE
jgi:hypothetical protein